MCWPGDHWSWKLLSYSECCCQQQFSKVIITQFNLRLILSCIATPISWFHCLFCRLGIATTLLSAVGDYVISEKSKLIQEKKCFFNDARLELDVDRSNRAAKALYFKNGYLPRFCWGNTFNHRQKMFKMFTVPGLVKQEITTTSPQDYNWDYQQLRLGFNARLPERPRGIVCKEGYTLSQM